MGEGRASRRLVAVVTTAGFLASLVVALPRAQATEIDGDAGHEALVAAKQAAGYLIGDPTRYRQYKDAADAAAAAGAARPTAPLPSTTSGSGPKAGTSWRGVDENDLSPPDSTGAIGPSSYIEFINIQMAIYSRTGGLISKNPFEKITGAANHTDMSDPQIIWDPHTQRYYYLIMNTADDTFYWGVQQDVEPQDGDHVQLVWVHR